MLDQSKPPQRPLANLRILRNESSWDLTISNTDHGIHASLHQVTGRVALQRIAEIQAMFDVDIQAPNGMPKTRRSSMEMNTLSDDDSAIRTALKSHLFAHQPKSVIWDEFTSFGGWARLDLAVITESDLLAYEIKSARDTLTRLPKQVMASELWADRAFLVADHGHIEEAITIIPNWWGVWSVSRGGNGIVFRETRASTSNPYPRRASHLLGYLRQPEVKAAIKLVLGTKYNQEQQRYASVHEMRAQILEILSSDQILALVRRALMNRNPEHRLAFRNRFARTQFHNIQGASWDRAVERILVQQQ
jgi:hypothetical protein